MTQKRPTLVIALTLASAAVTARAQSLTIDDFTSGPVTINFTGAKQTGDLDKTVHERGTHILGGKRTTSFELSLAANPYRQNATFQIAAATSAAPAALVSSSGFQMSTRFDMEYGNYVNAPLDVDLTPYDRFRVHFLALDGDQDIVMQTFSAAGNGEWGCSLAASPYHAVVVDLPFANSPGAGLSSVSEIAMTSQGGAYGYDVGISLIEAVPAGTPPADVTCPPLGG